MGFLNQAPLNSANLIRKAVSRKHGGVALFLGVVRDREGGRSIRSITYEAYRPMAEKEIGKIVEQVKKRWNVKVFVQHRVGKIRAGEQSLAVVCAGVHRKEAFRACEYAVNKIKNTVPIWKAKYECA